MARIVHHPRFEKTIAYLFGNQTKQTLTFQGASMDRDQLAQLPSVAKPPFELDSSFREIGSVQNEVLNYIHCSAYNCSQNASIELHKLPTSIANSAQFRNLSGRAVIRTEFISIWSPNGMAALPD